MKRKKSARGAMAAVPQGSTFGEVLEAVDRLSVEEQEDLAAIVRRRLVEQRRKQLAQDIQDGRREFASGKCRSTSVDELMGEILS
jgi:hypothetical protein